MEVERFTPYLGILAALVVGGFAAVFFGGIPAFEHPVTLASATSTAGAVVRVVSSPASVSPALPDKTIPAATSTVIAPPSATTSPAAKSSTVVTPPPAKISAPKIKTASSSVAALPAVQATPAVVPVVPVAPAELDAAATTLRGALVNILCYMPAGSGLHSISGSGVIIDPKGIILTNAHIAQYFLLADRGASCSVRTGSPAADNYRAALIYIPQIWLNLNKKVITQASPSGTGQYDFALLAITQSETARPLPASYPYIPLATMPPSAGAPVVIASYGAQFLDTSQIQSGLYPTVVFGAVKDIFTFAVNSVDVLSLGGSAAAQEGSSGGGIAGASDNLVGTITTSTVEGDTDSRTLGAITASYIRGEYATETGQPLDSLLAGPTSNALANFAPRIPSLEAIITSQLP